MFRITEDPSSGSLVQCLAKNCKNDSIVSVDMDRVGVMAAYCDRCACVVHCIWRHCELHTDTHTHTVYEGRAFIYSVCVCVCVCVVHSIRSHSELHTHNGHNMLP